MAYAQSTSVPAEKSKAEIMGLLAGFGVKQRAFIDDDDTGLCSIGFQWGGVSYKMSIIMPKEDHVSFHYSENGRARTASAAKNAFEQEVRRRWRSLVLNIKAKLVAVDDDITSFEQEFLAHAVTNNGQTVGERIIPALKEGDNSLKALGSGR